MTGVLRLVMLIAFCWVTMADGHCQKCSVSKVVTIANGDTIKYPFINYKNKLVSDKINQHVKKVFDHFGDTGDSAIISVKAALRDGLTSLDYTILFCSDNLLSFRLEYNGMGAYPTYYQEYYNFNDKGESLSITDLVMPSKITDFMVMLKLKQAVNINEAKADLLDRLKTKEIDNGEFEEHISEMKDNCMGYYKPGRFFVTDTGINIVIDCEFPHYAQSMNPNTDVVFSKKELKDFLYSKYQF